MKRKLFFSLIALVAVVITGFALSGNSTASQPSTPPEGMLFIVTINNNSLVQNCAKTVEISFGSKTMVKPYTGASTYYFYLNKPSFTGTVCAGITTEGDCGVDNLNIAGPCITSSWSSGDISTFPVKVWQDDL